ncbi:hypothetical protein P4C99_02195 [Pontiellaceae bacterium B1224]|nr:hypothetical protein [Pontiellaceae bacterium B1224]
MNIKAAELMGKLHDALKDGGYDGHVLEVYLVRLLFCLFADDTGIFEKDTFREYLEIKTAEDGSNLGALLAEFFQTLDTPRERRNKMLDEQLNQFQYVNGKLFEEPLPIAAFNSEMREILLECCALDWGKISPAIFGSMFQAVMSPEERRNLGAHYTTEKNILKLVKPLFLDELHTEFEKCRGSKKKLVDFHTKLSRLKFLDPACGCGNFLVITYRELRLLEMQILRELYKDGQTVLDVSEIMWIDVDQFCGIEYDEWPARIAEVAMWLMDHQMNMLVSEELGQYFVRLPLKKAASIVHGNALRIDWQDVVPKNELSYILGNPPFIGHHYQNAEQKEDMKCVFAKVKGSGVLDYVSAWYMKAGEYIQGTSISVAFVSTNSISQGEQVGLLWNALFTQFKLKIHFAHRTFSWTSEARGKATVHVVIIGFAAFDKKGKRIFDYEDIKGEPQEKSARNINPYLVDADDVVITNRSQPLANVPRMIWGNKPTDGGNFLFADAAEKDAFLEQEPNAEKWIRPYLSGRDFLHDAMRYCLWLKDVSPAELKALPKVMERVAGVRKMRLASKAEATRNKAATPTLFAQIAQPESNFLVVPEVSSERRTYIPIAYLPPERIVSNTIQIVPNASVFEFGVLTSAMHMAWMKCVCGRLKSDYRYSNTIVYNNYPWPLAPSEKNRKAVEAAAQGVLDARAEFPDSSLADLYDPLTMPPSLVKAHQALDRAVDLCYRPQPFPNETARIEFLFNLYAQYTEVLLNQGKKK